MLLHDLRYAFRSLRRQPGFATTAVLCIALGVGANGAIFSVVDGVLLQPLPYENPDRLVTLEETSPRGGAGRVFPSYAAVRAWQDETRSFADIAAVHAQSVVLSDRREPERYLAAAVSWNLFRALGVRPALGRSFTQDDDHTGAGRVAILADQLWRTRYESDPAVLGRSVVINGAPHTIVGVMPPAFNFPSNQVIWMPIAPALRQPGADRQAVLAVARLAPAATLQQAGADVAAAASRTSAADPARGRGWSAVARPLRERFIPAQTRLLTLTAMAAVTLVLLIACANVANLLLAKASARQGEIAIRRALGAGLPRVIRQLLTESVTLACVGLPLGILIAWAGITLLDQAVPRDLVPYYVRWSLDARTLLYVAGVAVATGLVFGVAPAFQLARPDVVSHLKGISRGVAGSRRYQWFRSTLVVGEIALALVLLVGALLFVRSFMNLQGAAAGFDTRPLLALRIFMPTESYATDESLVRRVDDLVARIEAVPRVERAFASSFVPLLGGGARARIVVEPPAFAAGEEPFMGVVAVTPEIFHTLDVPILRGRMFTPAEAAGGPPVAVVNEIMARRLWPDRDAVGQRFRPVDATTGEWFTVVGVVRAFHHFNVVETELATASAYVPYRFDPEPATGVTIRVEGGEAADVTAAVREAIRASDPALAIFDVRTVEELRQRGFWYYEVLGWTFSIFGAAALLLAGIGIYGLLSYVVAQRSHEIGVRMALGATRRDVLRLVLGFGLRLGAAGVAAGLLGALAVGRLIASLLYDVKPADPAILGGLSIVLALIVLVAAGVPAMRALRVDPVVTLRGE